MFASPYLHHSALMDYLALQRDVHHRGGRVKYIRTASRLQSKLSESKNAVLTCLTPPCLYYY